ncbi:hypothetical protein DSO57_1012493 [Entomophthora muscae]|uniref:Uncharacterized protein n=1 Tax=Entomophthora muscae TaxID=34485 RepID=A0ACC2SJ01_9FUNG|nr:hypothetical protein DSO57_1012493 [Entomophthora muscae]
MYIFNTQVVQKKFNYLPAYNLPMELPVTQKPMFASSPNLPTDHSGKLFGIVYITLTGVIKTIILAASPWSWVGKSASYLFKLAPLLWWALPAKNPAWVTPGNHGRLPKTGSLTIATILLLDPLSNIDDAGGCPNLVFALACLLSSGSEMVSVLLLLLVSVGDILRWPQRFPALFGVSNSI